MKKSILVKWAGAIGIGVILAMALALLQTTQAAVQRVKFQSGNNLLLIVEVLRDDLVHFELSGMGPGPDTSKAISITPQVAKKTGDYEGPSNFVRSGPGGNTLDTADMKVVVNTTNLCMTVTDKTKKNLELTTLCPLNLAQDGKGLTIAQGGMQHVYGLGEQFIAPDPKDPKGKWTADGDWTAPGHQMRSTPGSEFGNVMNDKGVNGGVAANTQFPVMYAVGVNNTNYALFLDDIYKQTWDFTGNPWKVETYGGDQIWGYVIIGRDLPDLRQDYMELTGHPPVPPKKMFGLWVSEYGYDSWNEINGKLKKLRDDKFPVDGFVLDLQWFGGITKNSDNSNMGRLTWDTTNFLKPVDTLKKYRDKEGIGIIPIEESYVRKGLPEQHTDTEHTELQNRGFLVREGCETCPPVYLDGVNDNNKDNWWS